MKKFQKKSNIAYKPNHQASILLKLRVSKAEAFMAENMRIF
jgi:hypothetical protein